MDLYLEMKEKEKLYMREQGRPGKDGKSAYEIWLEQGNEGTEKDFLDSLKVEGIITEEEKAEIAEDVAKQMEGKGYVTETELEAKNYVSADLTDGEESGVPATVNADTLGGYTLNDVISKAKPTEAENLALIERANASTVKFTAQALTDEQQKQARANISAVSADLEGSENIGLPDEYQQVEYIESTGTQYIDTGVIGNQNTGFEVEFLTHSNGRDFGTILGARQYSSVREYQISTYNNGIFRKHSKEYNAYFSPEELTKISLLSGNFNSGANSFEVSMDAFENPCNLTIFGLNENGTVVQFSKTRLYSLELYDGATLIRDFVPCYRISDGEIGLYDKINGVFYTNSGTGAFLRSNTEIRKGYLLNSPLKINEEDIYPLVFAQQVIMPNETRLPEVLKKLDNSLTSHGEEIVFNYPDSITIQVNNFSKWGKLCTFTIQFLVNTAISGNYGFSFCELPFAPTNRVWINNQTAFYMETGNKSIRCNGSTMNTGSYIWTGFYFTNE